MQGFDPEQCWAACGYLPDLNGWGLLITTNNNNNMLHYQGSIYCIHVIRIVFNSSKYLEPGKNKYFRQSRIKLETSMGVFEIGELEGENV